MSRVLLSKADLKDRLIPPPINRRWAAEYYEEDGHVYCERSHQGITELLVLKLGPHPVLENVCVYWDLVD